MKAKQLSILTVGDGDFSCSLALKRAYSSKVEQIVATTLLGSQNELFNTYPHSASILKAFLEDGSENVNGAYCTTSIIFGVDATQLHMHPKLKNMKFDLILFHHPHLGYENERNDKDGSFVSESPDRHKTKHYCLLAHYFDSALGLLKQDDFSNVHLCLSVNAVERWNLNSIVERLQLEYFPPPVASSRCLMSHWAEAIAQYKENQRASHVPVTGVKSRELLGGRRGHWLGKFGYRHQPTFPSATTFQTNISRSFHFFLRRKSINMNEARSFNGCTDQVAPDPKIFECDTCGQSFENKEVLLLHTKSPTLISSSHSSSTGC